MRHMTVWTLTAGAALIGANASAGTFATITIDDDHSDWAGIPVLDSDPLDNAGFVDIAETQIANDNDFSGMIQVLKNYIVSRGSWMTSNLLSQESSIPDTPTINFTGTAGYPSNDLQFSSSAYSSANWYSDGNTN